jgi:hypothetical protein
MDQRALAGLGVHAQWGPWPARARRGTGGALRTPRVQSSIDRHPLTAVCSKILN